MSKLDKLRNKVKSEGLSETLVEFADKMETHTKENIKKLNENPTKENLVETIETIDIDNMMSFSEKEDIKTILMKKYVDLFNFDNCPDDYENLKEEAKFLSAMTQYSFLLMAQRLLKIRAGKLYLNDGYPDFKSFIENEIKIARRTAYNYIDLIIFFGVQTFAHDRNFEFSKLLPIIPLLKSDNNEIPKEAIKKQFVSEIKIKSAREIMEEVKELKAKYGILKEKEEIKLIDKIKVEIENLSHDEKRELRDFMKRFE